VAVWTLFDGTDSRIQIRRRTRSGTLSPVQTLSAAGQDAVMPQVALDGNGGTLTVWTRFDGHRNRIQLRRRSSTGTLGPVRTLSAVGTESFTPQIAVDGDGNALVVWTGSGGGAYRVRLRRLSAAGVLGPIREISAPGGSRPQVAMDADGHALVVWHDSASSRIQLRRVSKSGGLSTVQTLSAAGVESHAPQLAIDANGNALVVWYGFGNGFGGYRIQARRRAASGELSAIQTLSRAGEDAVLPQVAINHHGSALVVWERYDGARWRIQVRRRSVTGGLNEVQTLSPAGIDAFRAHIAIDGGNDAVVAWQLYDGAAYSIQLRRRTSEGHLDAIHTLSDPGPRAVDPPVEIGVGGITLAVWSGLAGAHLRIQVAQPPG
jgi:hypothetical protein